MTFEERQAFPHTLILLPPIGATAMHSLSILSFLLSLFTYMSLSQAQSEALSGENCVICIKSIPICRCKPGEICIITKQTCQECSKAVCAIPNSVEHEMWKSKAQFTLNPDEDFSHNFI